MSNIHISIRDKLPQYEPATLICGNSDYRIVWELDGEWAAYDTKTMRVCLADGTYQDVLFQGTEAALPVLTVPGWISVGLYAGDVHTSQGAELRVLPSITTAGGVPADPPPDVYNQIMELLNGTPGVVTYSVTWELTNVTSSNAVTSVASGAALTATLTPDEGYTLGTVTVSMGGTAQTGVWDEGTATLTIPAVTGDVVVTCAGVKMTRVDTSPVIAENDKGLSQTPGTINNFPGACYTRVYTFTPDVEAIHASKYYDAENDYSTTAGAFGVIMIVSPSVKMVEAGYSQSMFATNASKTWLYRDGTPVEAKSNTYLTSSKDTGTPAKLQFSRYSTDELYANGVAFSLSMLDAEDSYAYWGTSLSGVYPIGVRVGDIIFAGKNTSYYGMANIDGTLPGQSVQALSVDQDIAMDYAVSTTSVLGSTPAADSGTAYGVSSGLADLVTEAKNAWMTEYGGDFRKIPLVITTDQHGRTNPGLFKLLGSTLSMHDVSKVCNLGDTVAVEWNDADTAHPLLSCAQLESWCESVKDIPFSKQLNVFGNHDTWYGNYADEGNPIGTRYPESQAHLNQYFRNIYARRTNNNGWFSVTDDQFNVKYVVISGFEYQGGSVKYRISTAQMDWIIDELGKNDGYDIIIVSHIPLYYDGYTNVYPTGMALPDDSHTAHIWRVVDLLDTDDLFNARKNKTTGSVTDSEDVLHEVNFSQCETELLCGLHGHSHIDAYNYVGHVNEGLLTITFDWFADNTLHFVLIDRSAKKLHVWKVEGDALKTTSYQVPFDSADSTV